ncbi:MAG: glycosyltransferase family 2 protein [Thainema sp.]
MNFQQTKVLSKPTISVVIPVHNGGKSFRQCLDSLKQSSQQPDEIIVVADGDTDGSWQVAESFGVKVFRYPTAGGPARARNRGAHAAQGDIVFFVDADVTIHRDTISRLIDVFQREKDLAAIIGSYDNAPGAENFLSQYKNLFHHYTHQISSEVASTFWGACGAIRRSAFQAVGGFDESYRKPCVEDIELGYRLKQAGYSIRMCKDIQVKHLKHWTPTSLLRAEIFYRALPWTELILSDRTFNADLNLNHKNRISVILTFALVASLVASLAASLVANEFMPWLLGVVAVLALGLLAINWDVYRFFYRQRGLWFALRVVPWHWFYFLYGGLAFAYGSLRHFSSQLHLPQPPMPWGVCKSR